MLMRFVMFLLFILKEKVHAFAGTTDVETSVFNDNVLVHVVLFLLLGQGPLGDHRPLEGHGEHSAHLREASGAGARIRDLSGCHQAHIAAPVGDLTGHANVAVEADAVGSLGLDGKINGHSGDLTAKHGFQINIHAKSPSLT